MTRWRPAEAETALGSPAKINTIMLWSLSILLICLVAYVDRGQLCKFVTALIEVDC